MSRGPLPRRRKDLAARLEALREGAETSSIGASSIGAGKSEVRDLDPSPEPVSEGRVVEPRTPLEVGGGFDRRRYARVRSARKGGDVAGSSVGSGEISNERRPGSRAPDPNALAVDEWIDPAAAPADHFAPDFPDRVPFTEDVIYLDLETTGLGAHECVALAGTVRPERGGVRLRQHFAFDPAQERTALERLLEDLDGATEIVTYNGRTFDLPFLRKRLAWHRLPRLDEGLAHLDLLVEIRRRFRKEWGSCSLGEAERRLLGKERTGPDVPGREVPLRFRDVKEGAPVALLTPVTHHNRIDLTSLVALHRWFMAQ